jgi:hypothetical protein
MNLTLKTESVASRKSKDISFAISFALVSFGYTLFVGQIGTMITGIAGINYIFAIGHAIIMSVSLLVYRGRRWRFFFQSLLLTLLIIPTHMAGTPFDALARIPMVINNFFADLLFNSLYGFFQRVNRLVWWATLAAITTTLLDSFFTVIIWSQIYSPEFMATYVNVVILMIPVIIVEAVAGGYLGYKIYGRVEKLV